MPNAFRVALWVFRVLVGVGAVWLFSLTKAPSLRALLLVLVGASMWNTFSPLVDLDRTAKVYFPPYLRVAARQGVTAALALSYYLRFGESLVGKFACLVLFAFPLRYLYACTLLVLVSGRVVHGLRKTLADRGALGALHSYILVTVEHGPLSAKVLSRFFVGFALAQWRARSSRLVKSIRSDLLEERLEAAEAQVGRSAVAFIGAHFGFFVAPRSLLGILDTRGLEACGSDLHDKAQEMAVGHLIAPGPGNNLLGLLTNPERLRLHDLLSRASISRDVQRARTLGDVATLRDAHSTPGPCFILPLIPPGMPVGDFSEASEDTLEGYDVLSSPQIQLGVAYDSVAQRMRAAALPMGRSDAELPPGRRQLIFEIGQVGLPPIADCYLRLRLSVSDVERFVVLLECFEALFKYCVFALAGARPAGGPGTEKLLGQRPTMGTWVGALSELTRDREGIASPSLRGIAEVWGVRETSTACMEFSRAVRKLGVLIDEPVPTTNVGWLAWLTKLRNATRGHGGLKEMSAGALWHGLHGAFLELVYELRPLTLESELLSADSDEAVVRFRGWRRGPYRTSTLGLSPLDLPSHATRIVLKVGGTKVLLAPYTITRANECWTWNGAGSVRGASDYVDYSSGKVRALTS